MKIAFFTFSALPVIGGYQIFAYNLAEELVKRGHVVDYYMPRRYVSMLAKTALQPLFSVRPFFFAEGKFSQWFGALLRLRLQQLQYSNKYDIWQVIGAYPAGYISTSLVSAVPVILRCHGEDIQKNRELNYGVRLDQDIENKIKYTLETMSKIVALTPSVSSCYHELGISPEKIVEIPNAISPERFAIATDNKMRMELEMESDELLILTVGRYHRKKGYEYIPDAARQLQKEGIRFKWLIVGKGLDGIKAQIKHVGVDQYVICKDNIGIASSFLDRAEVSVPDETLIRLYRQADIFVMPSLMETFGMVLIEAMAAGVPVVSTTAPGCRDVVQNGATGLLASPGNSEELAQAISKLCKNKELRNTLQLTAKTQLGRYSWDTVVNQYEVLYKEVLPNYTINQ